MTRILAAVLASLTLSAACGDAGPTTPAADRDSTPIPISSDVITVAVGESVTFTVGRNNTAPTPSAISGAMEFPIYYRPVRIRSAVAVTAMLRLVSEVVPGTKIWQPGTIWYCCGSPEAIVNVRVGSEVEVEVQNPPGYAGTQTLTLVATPVGP